MNSSVQKQSREIERLLVIDDVDVHRVIIRRIAAKSGFHVDDVADVEAARWLLDQRDYACISLDLSLGERAGTEILYDLRERRFDGRVIVISASEESGANSAVELGRQLGLKMMPPIGKPVDLAMLRNALSQLKSTLDASSELDF